MSWNCFYGTSFSRTGGPLAEESVEAVTVQVPEQLDGDSCGVHVLESVKFFLDRVAAVGRSAAVTELRSGRLFSLFDLLE